MRPHPSFNRALSPFPRKSGMSPLLLRPRIHARGLKHRHREWRDVGGFERADFAHALLLHLVDAQDGMHRQHGALDTLEFGLDAFFARVEYDRRALPENQLFNLDEAEQ